jgi:hypothetical protein
MAGGQYCCSSLQLGSRNERRAAEVKGDLHSFEVVFEPTSGLQVHLPDTKARAKKDVSLRSPVTWFVKSDETGLDEDGKTKQQCEDTEKKKKKKKERRKKQDPSKRPPGSRVAYR